MVGPRDSWENKECIREVWRFVEDPRCFKKAVYSSDLFWEDREKLPVCWIVELKSQCVFEADRNFSTGLEVDRAVLNTPWADD